MLTQHSRYIAVIFLCVTRKGHPKARPYGRGMGCRSRVQIWPKFHHYKYWNWCRCIQRKDSAGVILTASWFNDINIGYRFHISTVCHSCCNNVMYFSKENLDISGSAWKKYHAGMAFLLARIVLVLKLYIQGESCVRPMQASAARLRPGSGILFMTYIDICII